MKKGIAIAATFIGGIAVGATLGLLFAPEKGVDQRRKIKEALRKHGIKIGKSDLDELVEDIDQATEEA
jgi:gas vesicle protein